MSSTQNEDKWRAAVLEDSVRRRAKCLDANFSSLCKGLELVRIGREMIETQMKKYDVDRLGHKHPEECEKFHKRIDGHGTRAQITRALGALMAELEERQRVMAADGYRLVDGQWVRGETIREGILKGFLVEMLNACEDDWIDDSEYFVDAWHRKVRDFLGVTYGEG